jgi:hypothetical protein
VPRNDLQVAAGGEAGGEKALKGHKSPGPKAKLTDRQKRQVFRWMIGKDPRQYGFGLGLWTRKIDGASKKALR